MPYITQTQRDEVDPELGGMIVSLKLRTDDKTLDGTLNYVITRLLHALYEPKYFNYNRAMGVLACAQQEFYRRVVAPYEDGAIEKNGDL